jgi:hypothetical protein
VTTDVLLFVTSGSSGIALTVAVLVWLPVAPAFSVRETVLVAPTLLHPALPF